MRGSPGSHARVGITAMPPKHETTGDTGCHCHCRNSHSRLPGNSVKLVIGSDAQNEFDGELLSDQEISAMRISALVCFSALAAFWAVAVAVTGATAEDHITVIQLAELGEGNA